MIVCSGLGNVGVNLIVGIAAERNSVFRIVGVGDMNSFTIALGENVVDVKGSRGTFVWEWGLTFVSISFTDPLLLSI